MADEVDETCAMRRFRRLHRVDAEVAELARGQYGVVTMRQLRDLGLSRDAVGRRLRAGRLHRVHRGVYAVGHPLLSRHGIWLAAVLAVEGAVLSHRLASPSSLDALVGRYPRRPGTPAIKALLDDRRIGANVTKEELEHRFRAFLDDHGLPRPHTNVDLALYDGAWIKPDFLWPHAKLIVELDGAATHHTRAAFESDRTRDRKAVASGYRVVRITWRQLHDDPATLAIELRALLRARP